MKTIFLALLLSAQMLFAQSRTNKVIPEFSKKSEKLTKATGWFNNTTTGKWVENENVISKRYCGEYCISSVRQNFTYIQLNELTVNGEEYLVLLYEKETGHYKYPSIRKGWEDDKEIYFTVFKPKYFSSFKSQLALKDNSIIRLKTNIYGSLSNRFSTLGGEHSYNDENLINKIIQKINKPSRSTTDLMFNSQTVDGLDVIRFRLKDLLSVKDERFRNEYFEIKFSDFKF